MKHWPLYISALLLIGCNTWGDPTPWNGNGNQENGGNNGNGGPDTIVVKDTIAEDSVDDQEWKEVISIVYNDNSVNITNPMQGKGIEVSETGGYVTINSTKKHIEYAISGNGNGQLKIYSENKLKLSLNGLNLTCNNGPAINIQCKKTIYVVLSGNNKLSDTKGYDTEVVVNDSTEDQKGAFFSEGQLIFSGAGKIEYTNGSYTGGSQYTTATGTTTSSGKSGPGGGPGGPGGGPGGGGPRW